jgi:hypothetical protein
MSLFGNVDLKTTELPDALEFIVTREDSLLETFAIPAITILVMWAFFWRTGNLWLRIISGSATGFTILAAFANWIQGGETKLRVTFNGVIAEGNLGQLFSTSISVAIADISSIGFMMAVEMAASPACTFATAGALYPCFHISARAKRNSS